ncbi:hypothetical protein R1flu_019333 [Riccia fluitans]|uniref:Uncharacterized protein n=1 Tax=Riccia fluitans TaxID=41844 RepID=A0ABD1ZIP3_9MARC
MGSAIDQLSKGTGGEEKVIGHVPPFAAYLRSACTPGECFLITGGSAREAYRHRLPYPIRRIRTPWSCHVHGRSCLALNPYGDRWFGEGGLCFSRCFLSVSLRISLLCKRFTPLVNATEGEIRVRGGGRNAVVAARLQPHTGPSSHGPAQGKNLQSTEVMSEHGWSASTPSGLSTLRKGG